MLRELGLRPPDMAHATETIHNKPDLELAEGSFTKAEVNAVEDLPESDQRLLELGYRPEFRREMSLFGVLGISFCAIGILTGMSSAFQTGLFSGGPLSLFWGWNVSVAELLYFWTRAELFLR